MNRQRLLLAILAVVLVLSLVYAFWAAPRQEQAPARRAAPSAKPVAREAQPAVKSGKVAGPKAAAKDKAASGHLHLDLLEGDSQPFPGSGRDIFRFNAKWTPVPENTVAEVVETPPPPPPPPPPTPEEILSRDLTGYKVTGLLEKRGVRSLFVTDGKDILVIKAGDRFGPRKRFLASEVTATELVVSEADAPSVSVRLPLGDTGGAEPAVISPVSVGRPAPEAAAEQPGRRLRARPASRPAAEEEMQPVTPEVEMQPPSGEEQ
jgi:hypothetical protein